MGTPYKMKGSPMARNFGVGSPLHQDKMKASQTKIDAKTGVTTVDKNPGSKTSFDVKPKLVNEFFKEIKPQKGKFTNPIITEEEKNRKKSTTPANN